MKKFLAIVGLLVLTSCASSQTHTINGRKGGYTICLFTKSGCYKDAVKECNGNIDYIKFGRAIDGYEAFYQCKGNGTGIKEEEATQKIDLTIRNK